jgi:CheY-like chemotaxis protein
MVHGLAAQSGGAMTLSSEAGAGTTVRVWLPRSHSAGEGSTCLERTGAKASLRQGRSKPSTILLVDDDILVRTGTVAMLEDLGHVVIEADSAMRALERLADQGTAIDIVITDHAMPGMKGLDLVRLLRTSHPQLPVVLASGYAEITDAENASELLRLSKPFGQAELEAAITTAVGEQRENVGNVVSFRS